jgi:hypothetical protein
MLKACGRSALSLVVFALSSAVASVAAAQTQIGGESINLPPPAGFCELKDSEPAYMAIGQVLAKSGLRLLGMSADCEQLADWHSQKRQLLDDYVQYQASISPTDTSLSAAPAETIKQVCAQRRTQGDNIVSSVLPDVKSHIEQLFARIRINESAFVGVLAEEPTACYWAIIQKMRTDYGTDKTQAILSADTILRGKYVYVHRYGVYLSSDVIGDLLAKLKANVAALLAANRR